VSLLRADLGETRADLRSRIVRIAADLHEAREALVVQGGALAQLAGAVESQGRALAEATRTQGHHTDLLMQHGRALEEILRRLPAGPE
jgi:nitrogen fixation/metabolism regulation signal transduction histidine kinase